MQGAGHSSLPWLSLCSAQPSGPVSAPISLMLLPGLQYAGCRSWFYMLPFFSSEPSRCLSSALSPDHPNSNLSRC